MLTRPFFKDLIGMAARVILGGIFVYASVYKIGDPAVFAREIFNYRILPGVLINPLAIVLPWMQLLAGVGLIVNRWTLGALGWIIGMLVVFQVALGSALVRGLNVSCGCFSAGGEAATWLTFARDSSFLVLALFVAWHLITKIRRHESTGLWIGADRIHG